MSEVKETKRYYQVKEAAHLTGLTEHTVRNYLNDFNIFVERTEGNHRRLTDETIKQLLEVIRLKEEHGYSMKEIRAQLNGELTPRMLEKNEPLKTAIEKRVDELEENLSTKTEEMSSMKEAMEVLMKQNSMLLEQNKEMYEQNRVMHNEIKLLRQEREAENLRIESYMKALPETAASLDNQRVLDRANDEQKRATELKIRMEARKKAIILWESKPEEERMIKGGFLGLQKIEDKSKREEFIKNYIDEMLLKHIESQSQTSSEDDSKSIS